MTTRTQEQSVAEPTATMASNHSFQLISNEKLLQLYTAMVKCRIIEERLRFFFELGNFPGYDSAGLGQEAAVVGVAIDLGPEDIIAPSSHNLIVHSIKGEPLGKMISRLYVRADRTSHASQFNSAIGAALANKKKNNGKIVISFLGDRAALLGSWLEAIRIAQAKQLPILFVCQSNPGAEETALRVADCGIPCITVDGYDVVAVYRVATESIIHARKGYGPTLIECQIDRSEARDPILNMETYLQRKGLFREELKLEVAAGIAMEMDAAVEALPWLQKC